MMMLASARTSGVTKTISKVLRAVSLIVSLIPVADSHVSVQFESARTAIA
jgi:hypothetical protein